MEWLAARAVAQSQYTPPSPSIKSFQTQCQMKIAYFSNELPQDDLRGVLRRLQLRSKESDFAVLAKFLHEAMSALRQEVHQLPTALARVIPPFDSVLQLADHASLLDGPLGGAIQGVLLCTVQLGALIAFYESSVPEESEPITIDTCLSGLGIGLLASAGVSLAPTLADVSHTGAEVVRLAFRLGVLVDEVSQHLKPAQMTKESLSNDSWAYVVANVAASEAQKELDHVHETEQTSSSNRIFISAVSRDSITVSGPPSRLKHLFLHSEFFRDRKWVALPVYSGLCHAEHVYTREHIHSIVETPSLALLDRKFIPQLPIFSTSTGQPYVAQSAKELLLSIIKEILTRTIRWDDAIEGIVQRANESGASDICVFTFRQSLPAKELVSALGASTTDCTTHVVDVLASLGKSGPRSGPRGTAQSKLAIVGMSCRLPGATSNEEFWEILEKGFDMSRVIPADRFDIETHYDSEGKQLNKSMTQYGCFIENPGLFDAAFFNMSPREAETIDPQMRLSLVTAYEALESAGYIGNRTAATKLERIGTFYGQAADDYREVNQGQEVGTYYIPGGCRAFGPGRINYFFKFAGPSYSIDTACSSGLAAIEVACQALWNGEIDTAVTGGVNILTNPDGFAGLCKGHFLTKTHNACKTWDATADGYCRADGVGSLVIKRLEDAEADNDNILGVILGAGTNHSAQAVSITHPHAGHQEYLAQQVLRHAGVDPLDVSYVELHGTGTQAGDHEEIQGIINVYAPLTPVRRNKEQPLYIGASKANIGHGESVAGTTALIKTLLMLQNNVIPQHIGIKTEINPRFPKDFGKRNLHIPFQNTPWPQVPGKKRLVAVNNFGAAGGNTTMILEEKPSRAAARPDPRPAHVVAVSAKSKTSFAGNLERMISYLDKHPTVSLADLGYTTTARRYAHNYRVVAAVSQVTQLKKQLEECLHEVHSHQPIPSTPPPVVFAFTGQGASYRSMNLELFRDPTSVRTELLHLDSLAQAQGFESFIPVIDGSHEQDYAHSPVATQLALTCIEMALAKYWMSLGVRPDVVIGHSLGEYAALYVAGVLAAADAIFLVGRRAQMLEQRCQQGSHKMLAVRASHSDIQVSVAGTGISFEVACFNGPSDTVCCGPRAEIDALTAVLAEKGIKCFNLEVAFAFHSSQTDPILDDFELIAKSAVTFYPPNLPIISPLLGKVIFDEKTVNAQYVRRATREPVHFQAALENAQSLSIIDETMLWIEIGPHPVCLGFAKSVLPEVSVAVPSLRRGQNAWQTMGNSLASVHSSGVQVDWNEFHRPFEAGSLRLVDLPAYVWNEKNYWLQYNGDWCLRKGNNFYGTEKTASTVQQAPTLSSIRTSLVQRVIAEDFSELAGKITIRSDVMESDFFAATWGHQMNGCGVATSSLHADVAYTLGGYILDQMRPGSKRSALEIRNLEVLRGLVASKDRTRPQLIEVSAEVEDFDSGAAFIHWRTVSNNDEISEPFATATLVYSSASDWTHEWSSITHLIQGRIETLERLSAEGIANRFSRTMAYRLFAQNLVDYAQKYRGMESVVMHELEAFADVTLSEEKGGIWTVPPYFIDSVAHLAGFVMNVSDANDTKNNFFVTPGWGAMRFARPFVAGAKYRSYVKMIPTAEDPSIYLGNVYVLQDGEIMGMVTAIKFRQYPRILLDRFFSSPEGGPSTTSAPARPSTNLSRPKAMQVDLSKPSNTVTAMESKPSPSAAPGQAAAITVSPAVEVPQDDSNSIAVKAMNLIATEAGLTLSDLSDDRSFTDLGIDSLMSLVIAERFREKLGVSVTGSLFLEFPCVGNLREWLLEYYS